VFRKYFPKEIKIKQRVFEQSILIASIVKWTLLAIIIGTVVGFSTGLFLFSLDITISFFNRFNYYFFILPIIILLIAITIRNISPESEGHGTEKVIESIHKTHGQISWKVIPIKAITSILTITFGGSVGKEGPCAQIGGGIASLFSNILKFHPIDRKKLVICGISAGFAAVFGTPIAGALFGVEVLFIGQIFYEVLYPSFIAGIVGFQTCRLFGITYFTHPINLVPKFTDLFLLKVVAFSILIGLVAYLFIETLNFTHKKFKKIPYKKRAILGGLLVVFIVQVTSRRYLGLGLDTIAQAINGEHIPKLAFLWKTIVTSITLSCGGSGGIVTPIFYVGAASGNLFARIFNFDLGTFSAIGMTSLLAACTNTPIASSVMAIELFGPKVGIYSAICSIISFTIVGYRSVYPSQILGVLKSQSFKVELNKEIKDVESTEQFKMFSQRNTLTHIIISIYLKIKKCRLFMKKKK